MTPKEFAVMSIQIDADRLIRKAQANDVVLTIELEPLLPLAQGNYKMVVSVREART